MRHMVLLRTLGITLNTRKAAAEMNISQPSASVMLREIEDAVETELFDREAHGLKPTPAGWVMIEWAGIILADLDRASNDLKQLHLGVGSRIRVGLSPLAVPKLLPKAMEIFRRTNPLTVVAIQTGIEDTLIPLIMDGEIDIAISRLVHKLTHSAIDYEILGSEPARIVVRKDHPLAGKEALTPEEIDCYDWLLPGNSGGPYERVSASLVSMGAKPPNVLMEGWSALVAANMIESTDLLTVMPNSVALSLPTLSPLPIEIPHLLYPVVLFSRPASMQNMFLEHFKRAVRQAAGELYA
jgi:DNA-binding transcriptional LysR family regulator